MGEACKFKIESFQNESPTSHESREKSKKLDCEESMSQKLHRSVEVQFDNDVNDIELEYQKVKDELVNKKQEVDKLSIALQRYESKCKQMIQQYDKLTGEINIWKGEAEDSKRKLSLSQDKISEMTKTLSNYEQLS